MSQHLELTFVLKKSSQKKIQILNKISHGMIILLFYLFNLANVQAQDSAKNFLFSNNAIAKANQKLKESHKRKVSNFSFKESSADSIGQAFSLDTVSDIVQDNFGGTNFFVQYNTPFYLHYVNDLVHSNQIDEFLNSSAAEKLFIYQSMSTAVNLLKTSALEPLYRQCIKQLKTFRNYTSVKFDQDGKGNLGVVSPGKTHEDPLFELKLHVSANNGVEPRLEVGKHLLFRYDVFHQNALMEFRSNF